MNISEMMSMYHSLQFVEELLDYIEQYPDDDYMTMECLCRKLVKYGLLDKADGYYQTHEIRTNTHECVKDTHDKTENSSEKPNNCEPKICDTCRYYNSNIPCGSTPSACKDADKFAEEFVDGLKKLKPQKWETPPKFEHKEFTTTCVSAPAWAVVDEPQTYITEDRDTQILDAWQVKLKAEQTEPQTDCSWK